MAYIGKRPEDALRGNASYNAFTGDGSTTTFDVTNLLTDGGQFDVQVLVDQLTEEFKEAVDDFNQKSSY